MSSPRRMSEEAINDLRQCITLFLTQWRRTGQTRQIKHHVIWHLPEQAAFMGNPECSFNYEDESFNRVFQACGAGSIARLHSQQALARWVLADSNSAKELRTTIGLPSRSNRG